MDQSSRLSTVSVEWVETMAQLNASLPPKCPSIDMTDSKQIHGVRRDTTESSIESGLRTMATIMLSLKQISAAVQQCYSDGPDIRAYHELLSVHVAVPRWIPHRPAMKYDSTT